MSTTFVMLAASLIPAAESQDLFESKIRPLLAEHCIACHGPKKQNAGLRLDSREAILRGSDNGPVVTIGNPDKSLLMEAVRHQGPKMPPKGKLDTAAIDALAAWVRLGLPWPEAKVTAANKSAAIDAGQHWAFQPLRQATHEPNAIDRMLRARLQDKGLELSSVADRRTLIRRVTFDLIGLPPTPDEITDFERDPTPDAFARVVDRLLASPHYGERWARHWLDVARYADTKGYVFFEEAAYPWAYTYRDYVIRAFNDDLPYDRFILEQLAADRLSLGEDKRPLTALGFLTLGGRFMNNQHDILDDRIDVVTRGLLGLTVTCARCHDHKYDPIPSKDYYGLYGVFASSAEPTIAPLFEPPPRTEEYAKFDRELQVREKKLTDFVQGKHTELVSAARQRVAEYWLAAHALRDQPSTADFMLLADTADLNPTMIQRWKVFLDRRARQPDPVLAPWFAFASVPEKDFGATSSRLLADETLHPWVRKLFTAPPNSLTEVAQRYGQLLNEWDKKWSDALDRPRDALEAPLFALFHGPDAPPNVKMLPYGDLSLLPDRPSQAKLQEHRKALEQWRATGPGAPPRAHVLEEAPTPFDARVFLRGNPNNLGEPAPRRMLAIVDPKQPPFRTGSGRLELAQAIVHPDNPLTARVFVNRVWMHHFGAGLVTTPSDFGLRSDPPSHPELLDVLARSFMAQGWSIKKLHRTILLSHAYQQESKDHALGLKLDPENRLLWKMNRRRLDFEATRDALLSVSDRLDHALGGSSVKDHLAATARRRTLYSHLDRLNVPGLFRTFDFPSPDATSPQRSDTTIAPQALFLMNHPFVLGCAKQLANRPDLAATKDLDEKVGRLVRLLYGRDATDAQLSLAREFLVASSWERFAHAMLMANEFVMVD